MGYMYRHKALVQVVRWHALRQFREVLVIWEVAGRGRLCQGSNLCSEEEFGKKNENENHSRERYGISSQSRDHMHYG